MECAVLPQPLQANAWCPECAQALSKAPSADPFAICLSCSSRHRLFILPEPSVFQITAQAESLDFPELENKDIIDVGIFWLSEPKARAYLSEQLGQLLRYIIEAVRDGHRLGGNHTFNWCPICKHPLAKFDQPDIWIQGLRCEHGHEYSERSSRLKGRIGEEFVDIQAEFSQRDVESLVKAWLKDEPMLKTQLHSSVKRVFEEYLLSVDG